MVFTTVHHAYWFSHISPHHQASQSLRERTVCVSFVLTTVPGSHGNRSINIFWINEDRTHESCQFPQQPTAPATITCMRTGPHPPRPPQSCSSTAPGTEKVLRMNEMVEWMNKKSDRTYRTYFFICNCPFTNLCFSFKFKVFCHLLISNMIFWTWVYFKHFLLLSVTALDTHNYEFILSLTPFPMYLFPEVQANLYTLLHCLLTDLRVF